MVAIEGRVYALIVHNAVQHLLTKEQLPEWNENDLLMVDVTDITPPVQVGLFRDPETGEFFEPPPIVEEVTNE